MAEQGLWEMVATLRLESVSFGVSDCSAARRPVFLESDYQLSRS
jgi:hypothetical protein